MCYPFSFTRYYSIGFEFEVKTRGGRFCQVVRRQASVVHNGVLDWLEL